MPFLANFVKFRSYEYHVYILLNNDNDGVLLFALTFPGNQNEGQGGPYFIWIGVLFCFALMICFLTCQEKVAIKWLRLIGTFCNSGCFRLHDQFSHSIS